MSLHDDMKARLSELRANIDSKIEKRGAVLDVALTEARGLTDAEQASHDGLTAEITELRTREPLMEQRVAELAESERREALAAKARVESGSTGEQRSGGAQVTDPEVYAKGNHQRSFWLDAFRSNVGGDPQAGERLRRHAAQMGDVETRALGNTNTTGGSGGELAPPLWLVQDYIKLARAGRVTADLYMKSDVPTGVSSVNLPRILTGTTVAPQTTQNTALSQTDLTTGFVSTGFVTIGGKQLVSQQLLDQSAIDFDTVITSDLAAAYAQQIGSQVLNGAGTGANNNAVVNGLNNATVANTQALAASFTATNFYSKANGLLAGFATTRFLPPEVWVMHPRRWYWLMAQVDANGRPLVVPRDVAFNPIGSNEDPSGVQGAVGHFLGLPVVIDPNMGTTFGTGTNEDRVFLLRASDLWLFESPTVAEVFRETYADQNSVLFRLYSYAGTILNRYPASVATLTGLTPPAF
jgi:HK97 family phage major capsid protein